MFVLSPLKCSVLAL